MRVIKIGNRTNKAVSAAPLNLPEGPPQGLSDFHVPHLLGDQNAERSNKRPGSRPDGFPKAAGEKLVASPASVKKHPLHPMLVALPIGLWVFALVCDIIAAAGGISIWSTVALYCVAGGIVGAGIAAVPGLIDYFSIDEAAMRRIANLHLIVNLGAVAVFAVNFWSRFSLAPGSVVPLMLSVVGVICIGVGGWLGGEMVYVKGMAVEAVEKLAKKVEEKPRLRRVS